MKRLIIVVLVCMVIVLPAQAAQTPIQHLVHSALIASQQGALP